jgi:hypothetical protein
MNNQLKTNKKILYLLIFLVFSCQDFLSAQEKPVIKRTSGTAQIRWEQDKDSKEAAKNKAFEAACLNALEKAFGTSVILGNDIYLQNVQNGNKVSSQTIFNTIGNTQVKGDVIEVVSKVFEEIEGKSVVDGKKIKTIDIKCDVDIWAKELTEPKLQIKAFTTKNVDIPESQTDFFENEDLYLYFLSPVSGFITVFNEDLKEAQRILPYQSMRDEFENGVPVEGNKPYFFFTNKNSYNVFGGKTIDADLLSLTAATARELNTLYIIFTKTPLNKPYLKENVGNLPDELKEKKWTLPKGLTTAEFQKWRIQNQQLRNDIQIMNIIISITKK